MTDTPTPSAAMVNDAARWRRAVSACLPGQTPETAVECVSHLALMDAEREIKAQAALLARAQKVISLLVVAAKVKDATPRTPLTIERVRKMINDPHPPLPAFTAVWVDTAELRHACLLAADIDRLMEPKP